MTLVVGRGRVGSGVAQATPSRPASLDTNTNKFTERHRKLRLNRYTEFKNIVRSYTALSEEARVRKNELDWSRKVERLNMCSKLAVFECRSCNGRAARRRFSCMDKLCPWCAQQRGRRYAERLLPAIASMSKPCHVVLTIKNRERLSDADAHLRRSFKKLVRRVQFSNCFAGGFVFEETTHSASGWHTHLHCILDGRMAQAALAVLWEKVTGDSKIVWITAINAKNMDDAIREAVKYPCKLSSVVDRPELVREYIEYFRGRRLAWSFGTMYNKLPEVDEDEREGEIEGQDACSEVCPHCQSTGHMVRVALEWRSYSCDLTSGGWWLWSPVVMLE